MAELAFQGILPTIKEKNFFTRVWKVGTPYTKDISSWEPIPRDEERKKSKRVANVQSYSLDSEEEEEVGLAKWTRSLASISQKPMKSSICYCRIGNFSFPPIKQFNDLKKKRYCKLYNSISHDTNDCKVFWQQKQLAIEQGRITFVETKISIKINGYYFPADY